MDRITFQLLQFKCVVCVYFDCNDISYAYSYCKWYVLVLYYILLCIIYVVG